MYDCKFVGVKDMILILGICREKVMRLCNEKPYGFPVIKVGRQYRADEAQLIAWKDRLYSGEFKDLSL